MPRCRTRTDRSPVIILAGLGLRLVHIRWHTITIGLDFDATLWDSTAVWRHHTGQPTFHNDNYATYSDPVAFAGGFDKFQQLLKETQTYEAMKPHQPLPHAIEVLTQLQRHHRWRPEIQWGRWGLSIRLARIHYVVITARSEDDELAAVYRILTEAGLQLREVVSCSGQAKVQYCLANGVAIHVEDEPETLRYAHAATGLEVCGLRYLYNSQVLDELGIPHGHDWLELEYQLYRLVRQHLHLT